MAHLKQIALLLALAALLFVAPDVARAQTAADSAGVLLGVATRLQAEGRTQLSRSILDLIVERYGSTPAGEEARRLRTQLRSTVADQSGRTELMVFGTSYGLWLGVAIPAAAGADGSAPYGVGLIAGGPAGFGISRAYARSRSLSVGQARAITFGGTFGSWQGMGWAKVLQNDPSGRALMTATVLGGVAGIGVGAMLSHKPITAGTATTVNFGGLWGTWYGTALAVVANGTTDQRMTAALLAGDAGIALTALAAPHWQLSRPRARLISISGVAGLLAGFGVLLITQPEDDNKMILVPVATSAAGLALGAHWTRTMPNQGASEGEGQGFGLLQPSVQPRTLVRLRHGRPERVPALGLTLLQARF